MIRQSMNKWFWGILSAGILSAITCRGQERTPGLEISGDGRYMETSGGKPFLWFGDTNWVLFHRTTPEEAGVYFSDRSLKGFNVIQAGLCGAGVIEGVTDPTHNRVTGLLPFHHSGSLPDPSKPNEDFFRHAEKMIELAAEHGLYIGLLPTWAEFVCPAWHNGPRIFTPENAGTYGEFLGKRFAGTSNIIWILGGDRNPYACDSSDIDIWRSLAEGIRMHDPGHLMTYHPKGPGCSAEWFHEEEWLDFHMYQSIRWPQDIPELSGLAWERQPSKPVVNGEPFYFGNRQIDPGFDDRIFRGQPYRSFISGSRGYTFGQHHVWFFDKDDGFKNFENHSGIHWHEKLDTRGTRWTVRAMEIIDALEWWKYEPDNSLITGEQGSGTDEIVACRLPDYSQVMVYFPTSHGTTLDLGRTGKPFVELTWYKTDERKEIRHTARGSQREVVPPDGWEDALLIVRGADQFRAGFENGDLKEVHSVHTDPGGSVERVPNPLKSKVNPSGHVLRFETTGSIPERAEVRVCGISELGEYWYGWQVLLPEEWQPALRSDQGGGADIITQWHRGGADLPRWSRGHPMTLNTDDEGHYRLSWNYGGPERVKKGAVLEGIHAFDDRGRWVSWAFHVKWAKEDTPGGGFMRLYHDGELVFSNEGPNHENIPTWMMWKTGIYHGNPSLLPTDPYVVYGDNYKVTGPEGDLETVNPYPNK